MNLFYKAYAMGVDPPPKWAWIVDEDVIDLTAMGVPSRVGTTGPSDADDVALAALAPGAELPAGYVVRKWKTYDDDGEHYHSGRIVVAADEDDGEGLFAPLTDFSMPDSGAVEIRYRNEETHKWETL